ncbi:hypothetical protein [Bradyrhizobium sp. CCBAU 53338]|uniref:hypothetical protein n=1 Tax=Bradyrhizobium sp. CCBAU 53338 TaxID=1325111 RepID=UPI00188B3BEA|nr:hypothetical protein [Bradyrhizobium sp. CCBAU 53338]QOZ51562.1 hypothetical protein XH90_09335 [Bradyrhizobium sp. CCBAU 53338]
MLGVPASAVGAALKAISTNSPAAVFPMAASETARLICASIAESHGMGADAVAELASMEFQCEVGPEATGDSRWHPNRRAPSKDSFVTQLAAVLESAGARDDDRTDVSPPIRAGFTLGWTPEGQALGLIHFDRPQRRVSFLYASATMIDKIDAGIRIREVEFDFGIRLDVEPVRLQHLARVMRDFGRSEATDDTTPMTEGSVNAPETTMWPQGWGLYTNSDQVCMIGRIDADRRFASDEEAIAHVESLAAMGEPTHERTMRFHLAREADLKFPWAAP